MASQRVKFSVGLFVACGICLGLASVIWLGMSRFLEKGNFYVTYFNESVQGLNKDSAVKYRGVTIGRVESIAVAPDSKLIQIVLKVESGQTLGRDMVAQLKMAGITGAVFVELDLKKEGEPDLTPPISFPSEYPIVASKPSEITMLIQGFDKILNRIKAMDFEGISQKLKFTLDNVNQMMADADVKGISSNLQSSLDAARHILNNERWESILESTESAAKSLDALMVKAKGSLKQVDGTLGRAEKILAENRKTIRGAIVEFKRAMENATALLKAGSSLVVGADETLIQLRRRLLVSVQNLERASGNLDRLMESLADQPSQLLLGEPPSPRTVDSGP